MTTKRPAIVTSIDTPWSYVLDHDAITFSNCVFMIGGIYYSSTVPEYTITGADGTIYLATWVNMDAGTCEIHEGADITDVTDATEPASTEAQNIFKLPLYEITKTTTGTVVRCKVNLRYFDSVPTLQAPPDGISLEMLGGGKDQIYGWNDIDNTTANGISQVLIADVDTGVISATGDGDTYELLCRVGGPGGPVGYMPIGEGDGSDPEDPNADGCDQNTHPASGGGGGGEEEDDDHPQDQDEEHPGEGDNGTGGDTGDSDHPAADDCYTTAA